MTQIDEPNLDKIDQEITDILLEHLVLANDNGQPYIQYTDTAVEAIKALIANQVREARIDELKQLEPPDQFTHYIALGKTNYCSMCGFDAIEFKKHINDRIAELKGDDK